MSYDEAISQALAMFAENYRGKFDAGEATVPLWIEGLRGAYPETILAVAMVWIQSEQWPPTIADIRKRAVPPDPPRPPSTISPRGFTVSLPRFTDEYGHDRGLMHLAVLRASRDLRQTSPELTPGGRKKATDLYDRLIADLERTLRSEGKNLADADALKEQAAQLVDRARRKIDSYTRA